MVVRGRNSLDWEYLAAALRADWLMAAREAGSAGIRRMLEAKSPGLVGSAQIANPCRRPRAATSLSGAATATMGFPAAMMPNILLGTTTPSRLRLMVTMWASGAARTEGRSGLRKNGKKRIFLE